MKQLFLQPTADNAAASHRGGGLFNLARSFLPIPPLIRLPLASLQSQTNPCQSLFIKTL